MEEELLLTIQVDQSDAQKQLVATEKSILSLKNEQKELNKEYKAGKISEDEYVKSNLAIQQAVKKEQDQKRTLVKLLDTEANSRNAARLKVAELTKQYNNLNTATEDGRKKSDALGKELEQLNATLNKGSKAAGSFKDNIGNYPKQVEAATKATVPFGHSIAKATDEIQPFGLSVGGATSSIGKFITPAGAALGILTGLVTMYANSAEGADDLAFAHDTLSSATSILSEGIADLIGSGEQEIGIFSQLTAALLFYIDSSLGAAAVQEATAKKRLRDLELNLSLSEAQAKIEQRIAEDARRIRDDESKSLEERLAQTEKIDNALKQSGKGVLDVLKQQVTAVIESTTNFAKNSEAQLKVSHLAEEIAQTEEKVTSKLTENVRARQAILKLIREENDLNAAIARADARIKTGPGIIATPDKSDPKKGETPEEVVAAQETQRLITEATVTEGELRVRANERIGSDILKFNKKLYADDLKAKKQNIDLKNRADLQALDYYAQISGSAASLFEQGTAQYKILASLSTLISTYSSAQKAFESQAGIPIFGPELGALAAASAIASGLANVAAINGVQFAEGGFTGKGAKYEVAGVVHKGEYVTPQQIVNSPAAQPHLAALENMRTRGFADGGFVTNESVSASQLALITANAIRNMPRPVVGVKQFVREWEAVEAKQNISKI